VLVSADAAFKLPPWHDFAVMVGGAAAALTGLVFVAVSIQLTAVTAEPVLRHRATSSIVFLFTIVAAAAAVLAPQSSRAVGIEFLALVFIGAFVGRRGLAAAGEQRDRLSRGLAIVQIPTALAGIVADISLIAQRGYGMYLASPCLVITAATTVASAWSVLLAAARESSAPD
jgi:hypothetical protein